MTNRLNSITTPRFEARAEKARRNKEAGLAAFIGRKAEIDEMLARLQALSDDHFNCHPDEVGWAMVGTLDHYPHAQPLRGAWSHLRQPSRLRNRWQSHPQYAARTATYWH